MRKVAYPLIIAAAILPFIGAYFSDKASGYWIGVGIGVLIIPLVIELNRFIVKKKVEYEPLSEDEILLYEEIVSFQLNKKNGIGKLFLTNQGLRFESPKSWLRKEEIKWSGSYKDIESIKNFKLVNLQINLLTQGIVEIGCDNRNKLKALLLQYIPQ